MDPPGGNANKSTTVLAIAVVLVILSLASTIIRLSVRFHNHQRGWDDLAIALAALLLCADFAFKSVSLTAGLGRHSYYLSENQISRALEFNYATQLLSFVIVCLTKISICLFVLRIKKTGWLKWCLSALMAGLVLTTLACEIILFAQCQPINAFWNREPDLCWPQYVHNDAIWAQVCKDTRKDDSSRELTLIKPTLYSQI